MNLRYYKILEKTKVEGPGVRFCIWVQGCSKHCPGCWAKETWDFNKGGKISTKELLTEIKASKDIEGVTFLGGEPFEQAQAVGILAKEIKKIGLSVLTFTGQIYEELLQKRDKNIQRLLKYTDLLIDGGFEIENFDLSRPWVGSKNQRYLFLSNYYKPDDIKKYKNKVEIRISKNGNWLINGMGDFAKLQQNILTEA